jgi:PAS domain S-box-containing protein
MSAETSTDGDDDRKLGQRSALTSEARMYALLEAAVDGIISIDARGRIQTINPAAERLFGYAAREVIGQNIKLLMPSPYREEHDDYLVHYLSTGEKKIIGIGREGVGQRKDGSTFPLDLSVAEARVGEERLFVGIIRDITERKRNEEALSRLAAIVESSDDAILTKSLDGTILTWNTGAERLFGYSASEVIGRHISMLAPPERQREATAFIERVRQGERIDHLETVRVRKGGRRMDVSVSVAPIKDASGKVCGASTIKREISEQMWQTAKLATVGEMAASIAHELNNPLSTVSLRIESALAHTPAEDPRRPALEIVEQEVQRMSELVSNLLQFARRGDGQNSTVDVCQELVSAVVLVQYHLDLRLISVLKEFAPNTPTIFADRQRLRQVFLNILSNASDAMPQGGTLTLRTAQASLDNGNAGVLIEVADTGAGIPTESLKLIMEPFFTTKEEGKGTGLGLAICRRVVLAHNGTIEVDSAEGKGTTVRILLPLKNDANVDSVRGTGHME